MREQIDNLDGIWGDEPVHASTASHGDETPKKTTQDRIEIKFHLRGKGGGLRLAVDFVGKGEPRTENAVVISEVDGGDGSGGAEMDEGEGIKICDGEGIHNPEGWRRRLAGRRQRKARRRRCLVDLV